ncbi:amidase [Lacisediminimonas sp.]|uniref:amidase n=1 Tax=Lacisediminimonas sp. TaxID=3060582 RepID=UPI002716D3DC|nr:amidase [Lacisediminimonas sp.]MDO8301014.1 amidase [Lacisediminimonas sp.]
MKPTELNRLSASQAAVKLQQREISAEQLVRSCLDRIEEREPAVQAWTQVAADSALAQARMLDSGPVRGLLHGLPIGVKDLFDTDGIATSYGSPIYANHVPDSDAAAVALAREAGAIVLGKTVTTEFATFHAGKTHNPHRPGHTPGGSSSGSAAAVADFMVPLAFGTQTAASVIRPAAFCGVVGYKPTYGSIVRAGVKSLSETLDTIGAFGRSVPDVALFVAALTGDKRLADTGNVDGLRIGLCRTHEWPLADPDTQAAFDLARRRLTAAGAVVTEIDLPAHLSTMVQVQTEVMAFDAARSLAHERVRHPAMLSSDLAALLASGMSISVEQHQRNLAGAALGRQLIDSVFDSCDVLFAPSAVGTAPEGILATGNPVFSRMWTLLGVPCVHLPFMTGAHGLPVGMQAVGRIGGDRGLLQAAHWMMEKLSG